MSDKFVRWIPIFEESGIRPKVTDEYLGFKKVNELGYNMGGCYMYAYDETGNIANEIPDHLDPRVVYIGTAGSTTHRGIHSRTADFAGSIVNGHNQKRPYHNGMIFRDKFGIENRKHLYVAYYPMGYDLKQETHDAEVELLTERKEVFGELPACHGSYTPVVTRRELRDILLSLSKEDAEWAAEFLVDEVI